MTEVILYVASSFISALAGMFYIGQKTKGFDMRLTAIEKLAPLANDVHIQKDRLDRLEISIDKHLTDIREDLRELGREIKELLKARHE